MFYGCIARFDVTGNLKKFLVFGVNNKALACLSCCALSLPCGISIPPAGVCKYSFLASKTISNKYNPNKAPIP